MKKLLNAILKNEIKLSLKAVVGLLALSSCAVPLVTDTTSSDNYHGYYKVGTPYQIDDEWYYPQEQPDYDKTGIASWYGDAFHGKKTANGDTFDKNSLTAAHNTLPLPSMVRVTNLENNKTLILMVNDRGPFARGRVLDVSERAAQILGYHDKGIARVRVQFLEGQTKRLLADLPGQKNKVPIINKSAKSTPSNLQEWGDTHIDAEELKTAVIEQDILELKPDINAGYVSPSEPINLMDDSLPEIKISSNNATPPKKMVVNVVDDAISAEEPVKVKFIDEPSSELVIESDLAKMPEEPITNAKPEVIKPAVSEKEKMVEKITDTEMPKAIVENFEEYFIQAGTFSNKENADRTEHALHALGDVSIERLIIKNRTLYRVKLGPIRDSDIAKLALNKVIKMGHADAMLIINNSSEK